MFSSAMSTLLLGTFPSPGLQILRIGLRVTSLAGKGPRLDAPGGLERRRELRPRSAVGERQFAPRARREVEPCRLERRFDLGRAREELVGQLPHLAVTVDQ